MILFQIANISRTKKKKKENLITLPPFPSSWPCLHRHNTKNTGENCNNAHGHEEKKPCRDSQSPCSARNLNPFIAGWAKSSRENHKSTLRSSVSHFACVTVWGSDFADRREPTPAAECSGDYASDDAAHAGDSPSHRRGTASLLFLAFLFRGGFLLKWYLGQNSFILPLEPSFPFKGVGNSPFAFLGVCPLSQTRARTWLQRGRC